MRDDPQAGILLRFNGHIELNGAHDAGGRKQAHIPVEQPVKGNLPPLVGEDIGPQLAVLYQQQAGTVHAPVVDHGPFFDLPINQAVQHTVFL